jgi:hypothetical protein
MIDGGQVAEAGGIKEAASLVLAFSPSDWSQEGVGGPITRS